MIIMYRIVKDDVPTSHWLYNYRNEEIITCDDNNGNIVFICNMFILKPSQEDAIDAIEEYTFNSKNN